MQATRGIADLITVPGEINLDFNDVRTVISKGGDAIMGVGVHSGENRAVEAARKAINSPLLEDVSISGSKGVLINIAAASNLTLFEVHEAMSLIQEATGSEATIIFGTVLDDSLEEDIRVTVIATGFNLGKEQTTGLGSLEQEGSINPINTPPAVIESPLHTDSPAVATGGGEVPAYLRDGNGTGSHEAQSEQQVPPTDNLDIPTFLRRKMNA